MSFAFNNAIRKYVMYIEQQYNIASFLIDAHT